MNAGVRATVLVATIMMLIGLSFLSAQTTEKPDNSVIEKAVLDTYAEITKVAENVDGEKLFSYVLENDKGAQINNGRLTITRQEAMGNYITNTRDITAVDYTMDKQYVTVMSPETAVMVVEGRYEATTADGQTFSSPMAQTVVFVLKGKEWKVLHSHMSQPINR